MSHRCLTVCEPGSPDFYLAALRYGNALWQNGHAGRALLALTRALYSDLPATSPVHREWPLPYQGIAWILHTHPNHDFPGNPRISFQHQATRLIGPRQELLRIRAWAVWALTRVAKPELEGDPRDPVPEPAYPVIHTQLQRHGHPGEAAIWQTAIDYLQSNPEAL